MSPPPDAGWAPPGFVVVRRGPGNVAIVRDDLRAWYEQGGLEDPEAVLGGSSAIAAEAGRGAIARIAPRGAAPLILRKYRRGGTFAGSLPDAFVGVGRMTAELAAIERARARSVPSVRAAGILLRRAGGLLWRGYLLTEEIAGATTLDRALAAMPPGALVARDLAARAVGVVRAMHEAGIVHGDLNLRNLLVRGGDVLLVDMDAARLPREVTPALRFENLSRLDRSYCKLFGDSGPLTSVDRRNLLGIYCQGDAAMRERFERRIPSHLCRVARHRLFWKR